MTDWSYQLEDIVWDEFRESGDHIVPHHSGAHVDGGDACHKKLLHEVVTSIGKSSDSKPVAKDLISERKEIIFPALNEGMGPMLEKGSWSCSPCVIFPDSCDIESSERKGMAGLGSDDSKVSGNCFESSNLDSLHNEFCESDTILGSKATSIDGSLCQFSFADISPTHSDIELLSNEHENKESNFLCYYGLPDIGNFEDADRMFRSCDSTFGQGFESSYPELGRVKHQEPDLKFMPVSATPVVIDIDKKDAPNTCITGLQTVDDSDSASLGYSYGNMLDAYSECERVSVSKEQGHEIDGRVQVKTSVITQTTSSEMANLEGKQLRNHFQTEGEREDQCSEYLNTGPFHNSGTTQQFPNRMKRSSNFSLNATSMTLEEKMCLQQKMQGTSTIDPQRKDLVARSASSDHFPVRKQLQKIEDGVGGHNDVGKRMELPAADSSGVLEGSGMSSVLSDEISLEATSFRQLQYVMEQLDIRTKLCIRDSLYRLARSAEQRNNFGNSNNCIWDGRNKCGVQTTEKSNKSAGIVDMETDTNPIDRSIAHLLFHRPSDHGEGALFIESCTNGSSQPVMPGRSVCQEEVSGEADTKLLTTDQ